jgi:hypothetical protein
VQYVEGKRIIISTRHMRSNVIQVDASSVTCFEYSILCSWVRA